MIFENTQRVEMKQNTVPAQAQAFLAPAKLNLMLHIVGRRDDGYHLLETVFRFIDLYDTIHVRVREDSNIVLHTLIEGVSAEQDLTVRAAKALQQHTQTNKGADLWVEKRIPMGGGLGGGSSDAATVLLALNHLWQTGLSRQELIDLGVKLGADVPVFVFGHNAFASGIGEVLTEVVLENQWYVVIKPNVHVQTAKIFAHEGLTRDSKPSIMRILNSTQMHRNDMQQVVLKEYEPVKTALEALKPYGNALMTGSGACVFVPLDSEQEARKISEKLSTQFETYCVQGLNEHPLSQLI